MIHCCDCGTRSQCSVAIKALVCGSSSQLNLLIVAFMHFLCRWTDCPFAIIVASALAHLSDSCCRRTNCSRLSSRSAYSFASFVATKLDRSCDLHRNQTGSAASIFAIIVVNRRTHSSDLHRRLTNHWRLSSRSKYSFAIIVATELASFRCDVCLNWTEQQIVTLPSDGFPDHNSTICNGLVQALSCNELFTTSRLQLDVSRYVGSWRCWKEGRPLYGFL